MHILNFLITILIPFVSPLAMLRPEDSLPYYFSSPQAQFIGAEFFVVIMYWAGLLRNPVIHGVISERTYFAITILTLIFVCISKIIFILPAAWIMSIFAFGLGVLSASNGQVLGYKSIIVLAIASLLILAFAAFNLIGLAWFDFKPSDYYYYQILLKDWLVE